MEADESFLSALEHVRSDDESSVLSDSSVLSESSGVSEETPKASVESIEVPEHGKHHGAGSSPKFRGTWHPQLPQPRARDLSLYARPPPAQSTVTYQETPPRKHSYTPPKPNVNFAELSAADAGESAKETGEKSPKKDVSRGHSYNPFDEHANFTGYQASKSTKSTEPRVQSWKKTGKDGYPVVADRLNYQGRHSFVPPRGAPPQEADAETGSTSANEPDASSKRQEDMGASEVKSSMQTASEVNERKSGPNDDFSFESKSQVSSPPHTARSGGSVDGEASESGQGSPFDRSSLLEKEHFMQGFEDLEEVIKSLSQQSEGAPPTLASEDERFELIDLDMKHEQTTKVKLLTSTYSGTVRAGGRQDSLRCLLEALGIEFEEVDGALTFLPEVVEERERLFSISGIRGNYPQLFVNDCFVGLFEDVQDLNETGQLKDILRYGLLEGEVLNAYP